MSMDQPKIPDFQADKNICECGTALPPDSAHSCRKCQRKLHSYCGGKHDKEGAGSKGICVWCKNKITGNDNVIESSNTYEPVAQWGDEINPTIMMEIIKKFPLNENLTGRNKKTFYSSYPKEYEKLTDSQKNNTMQWFNNCTEPGRAALIAMAIADTKDYKAAENSREINAHKNDYVRIFHLR